jgi:hypothetical protein
MVTMINSVNQMKSSESIKRMSAVWVFFPDTTI